MSRCKKKRSYERYFQTHPFPLNKRIMGGKKKSKPANNAPQANSDDEWDDSGSKKPSKKQLDQEAKKQEQALKKKEKEMLLAAEEASMPSKKGGKTKSHKSASLDDALNQFGDSSKKGHIDAEGLDDALSALTLLKKNAVGDHEIDRHPERRFKAALSDYTQTRLPQIRKENPGLRKQQMEQLIYKEFEKHPDNPFNKETNLSYNATGQDVSDLKNSIKDKRSKKFER